MKSNFDPNRQVPIWQLRANDPFPGFGKFDYAKVGGRMDADHNRALSWNEISAFEAKHGSSQGTFRLKNAVATAQEHSLARTVLMTGFERTCAGIGWGLNVVFRGGRTRRHLSD